MSKPVDNRWYEGGPVRLMAEADNWVMVRRPGCIPFTMYRSDWLKLPAKLDDERDAAEYRRLALAETERK